MGQHYFSTVLLWHILRIITIKKYLKILKAKWNKTCNFRFSNGTQISDFHWTAEKVQVSWEKYLMQLFKTTTVIKINIYCGPVMCPNHSKYSISSTLCVLRGIWFLKQINQTFEEYLILLVRELGLKWPAKGAGLVVQNVDRPNISCWIFLFFSFYLSSS